VRHTGILPFSLSWLTCRICSLSVYEVDLSGNREPEFEFVARLGLPTPFFEIVMYGDRILIMQRRDPGTGERWETVWDFKQGRYTSWYLPAPHTTVIHNVS